MTRLMTVLIFFVPAMVLAADDPIKAELEKARDKYAQGLDAAKTKLVAAMVAKLKEIADKGDLDKAKEVKAQKELFEKDGTLPMSSRLVRAKRDYESEVRAAREGLRKAIEKAKVDYTKALKLDQAEALAAELKGLAGAAPAKADSSDDGFQVGDKLVGTYSPIYINPFNGQRKVGGSELEVEITKRSGKEFTAEFWGGKRKTGVQYEGTIENGRVKARATKALTDSIAKEKVVGNALFTGRLNKGALTGTVRMPKINTTFRGEVKVKLSKE